MKKLFLYVAILLLHISLKAQHNIAFGFSFNHIALSVKDMKVSMDFYQKVFQLNEIALGTATNDVRLLSLGEGKELHLILNTTEKILANKPVHFAVTTSHFDDFLKRLNELKISYGDWAGTFHSIQKRSDGIRQVYLQDPDGFWIEINDVAASSLVQKIKDEIWQMEENYWKYVKTNDLHSYRTLWDEQFIGYPSTNTIAGKEHITDWITDMYKDKSRKFNYELTRKVENVFDNIVIVLYDVTQIWTNDKNEILEKTTYKITHTWKKTEKGWLIIGGMGAKK
jgi:catechol 2,3-dioxygenase-like lactoylglutathione lyase family enzyme